MKPTIYSLTTLEWENFFNEHKLSKNSLSFWLRGIVKDRNIWKNNISENTLNIVTNFFNFNLPDISKTLISTDHTIKFQVKFSDNLEVETVLIPFNKRYTICLSTQVGCAMNCSFCYTGTQGLKRNLKAHEIISQYMVGMNYLFENKISSIPPRIVFMGQGEPLHNFSEVNQAIKVFTDKNIFSLGPKEITLSTSGFSPGLKQAINLPKINFALSLHSPFNDQRKKLIPINQQYPLEEIFQFLDEISSKNDRIITYEYLLIKDFNMSKDHAEGLANLLSHRRAVLNLIPFNPFPGSHWQRPSTEEIDDFKNLLVDKKLRVFIRTTKGDDILAACGQLKINNLAKRNISP